MEKVFLRVAELADDSWWGHAEEAISLIVCACALNEQRLGDRVTDQLCNERVRRLRHLLSARLHVSQDRSTCQTRRHWRSACARWRNKIRAVSHCVVKAPRVSQGSVATRLRCGGLSCDVLISYLLPNVTTENRSAFGKVTSKSSLALFSTHSGQWPGFLRYPMCRRQHVHVGDCSSEDLYYPCDSGGADQSKSSLIAAIVMI